jgi:flavin reductase (DIM6/NTAB) family NADH-FMN oxidoreductase RutF
MDNDEAKQKLQGIWPEVIGAVISERDGVVNLCPVNYQAVPSVFEQPLSICIGLDNASYTLQTILQTGEFVYAYPSRRQLKDTLYCGTVSGRSGDKLQHTQLTFTASSRVRPPQLVDAVLNFECKLVHHYDAGSFTVVIGEVLNIVDSGKNNLDKIYALGDQQYGAIPAVEILQEGRSANESG